VAVHDGKMLSYSAGHISTPEAKELIEAIQGKLGSSDLNFYPGVNYRHILKIKGQPETLQATCTPPHDIANQPVAAYLPRGPGSNLLLDLMRSSEPVLSAHPVNKARAKRGETPANTIWLFWGSGQIPQMPPFQEEYGLRAAMTSGVDLLRGLAIMAGVKVLDIPGVTDGPDNDFAGQAKGALNALNAHDLVFIHVEAPDEAGHAGSSELKIDAIEKIDREILSRLRQPGFRVMVMPDHPTPVQTQTHNEDPVPFLIYGPGIAASGAKRFSEKEAEYGGILIDNGFKLMDDFVKSKPFE
jgi:2,3-bisphosphoglycerate-independent phosphoglycerate mutase